VPKDDITSALSQGADTIIKVDVQGAATIKEILPQAVFIFLMPPSVAELEKRLRKRHSESSSDLALRLERAKVEIKNLPIFDYVITSRQNKLNEVLSQIYAIVIAEKHSVKPKIVEF
jgi:guanylate kinase